MFYFFLLFYSDRKKGLITANHIILLYLRHWFFLFKEVRKFINKEDFFLRYLKILHVLITHWIRGIFCFKGHLGLNTASLRWWPIGTTCILHLSLVRNKWLMNWCKRIMHDILFCCIVFVFFLKAYSIKLCVNWFSNNQGQFTMWQVRPREIDGF